MSTSRESVGGRAAGATRNQEAEAAGPGALWAGVTWRHPEWWSVALGAMAWLLLILGTGVGVDGAAGPHHHGHATRAAASLSGDSSPWTLWVPRAFTWLLMVVAMMVPLVLGAIRTTAARSLWRRRDRAVGGFLVGYLALWLTAWLVLSVPVAALGAESWLHLPRAAAVGFAVAAAWQLTPMKRRALLSCHSTAPLAPRGWRADRDCLRYGWTIGTRCLASCWASMLACWLAGHGAAAIAAMACVSTIGTAERYLARPDQRVSCGVLSALALIYAAVPLR